MVDDQFWNVNSISELTYQNWPSTDPWFLSTGQPVTVFGPGAPFLDPPGRRGFYMCFVLLFLSQFCPSWGTIDSYQFVAGCRSLLQIKGFVGCQVYFGITCTKRYRTRILVYTLYTRMLVSESVRMAPPKCAHFWSPSASPIPTGHEPPFLLPQLFVPRIRVAGTPKMAQNGPMMFLPFSG